MKFLENRNSAKQECGPGPMSGQPAIGTGQTRVGQELIEEENEMRFLE